MKEPTSGSAKRSQVRVDVLLKQANVELHRRNYKAAVKLCDEALELDPRSADVYEMLGDAFAADGRFAKAMEAYRYGLRLDPGRALLEDKLARASLRQYDVHRKFERAQTIIESGSAHEKSLRKAGQLAAVLSFLAPGLGQVRNGQHFKGLAVLVCWLLLVLVVVLIVLQPMREIRKELREMGARARYHQRSYPDLVAEAVGRINRSAPMAVAFWGAILGALGLHAYAMVDASIVATRREEEDFL